MTFELLSLLPKLFASANKISALLRGGVTQAEMLEIVDELYALLRDIPALQGFMGILNVVVNIARVIIPALPSQPGMVKLLKDNGIDQIEIDAAAAVIDLMDELEVKAQKEGELVDLKVKSMSLDDMLKQI